MNNLEQINEIIKINKTPFISLKRKNGLNSINAGTYSCEDCSKDDNVETQLNKAVSWLNAYVKLFPLDTVFLIYMRPKRESNQGSVLGPFDFSVKGSIEEVEKSNGFNGVFPNIDNFKNLGFVSESEVKAKLLEKELSYERERHQRDVEDLRNEFKSEIEIIKNTSSSWSPGAMKDLVKETGSMLGLFKEDKNIEISGLPDGGKNEEVTDLKIISVNDFAEKLYQNFSLKEIEILKNNILEKK